MQSKTSQFLLHCTTYTFLTGEQSEDFFWKMDLKHHSPKCHLSVSFYAEIFLLVPSSHHLPTGNDNAGCDTIGSPQMPLDAIGCYLRRIVTRRRRTEQMCWTDDSTEWSLSLVRVKLLAGGNIRIYFVGKSMTHLVKEILNVYAWFQQMTLERCEVYSIQYEILKRFL